MKGRNWSGSDSVSEFPSNPNPKGSKKWIFWTVAILIVFAAIIFFIANF